MATMICPWCGETIDGQPDLEPTSSWWAKHHPDLPVGSVIPAACGDCLHDYKAGETIVARDPGDSTIYTVLALIESAGYPPLIHVRDSSGPQRTFAKSQIRPRRGQTIDAQPDPDRASGYF